MTWWQWLLIIVWPTSGWIGGTAVWLDEMDLDTAGAIFIFFYGGTCGPVAPFIFWLTGVLDRRRRARPPRPFKPSRPPRVLVKRRQP